MAHLYELSDKYQVLMQLLGDEETSEETLKAQAANIEEQFNVKAENIAKAILSMAADAQTLQTEASRLSSRRAQLDKKAEWLKSYLHQEMTASGIKKIEGLLLTLSLRAYPKSVQVINKEDLPKEFHHIIPETWQPDKKAILDHFNSTGEIPPGTEVITDRTTLVIK